MSEVENTWFLCLYVHSIPLPVWMMECFASRLVSHPMPCDLTCTGVHSLTEDRDRGHLSKPTLEGTFAFFSLAARALVTEGQGGVLRFRTVKKRNTTPSLPQPGCLLKPAAPNTSPQDKYRSKERNRFH